jgi:hypothetical protein
LGQKVRGFFAWVHGAGEVIRGRVKANIASLLGEQSTREIEEETARRGKREMINQEFEPVQAPLSPRSEKVSRKAERKREKREKSQQH